MILELICCFLTLLHSRTLWMGSGPQLAFHPAGRLSTVTDWPPTLPALRPRRNE